MRSMTRKVLGPARLAAPVASTRTRFNALHDAQGPGTRSLTHSPMTGPPGFNALHDAQGPGTRGADLRRADLSDVSMRSMTRKVLGPTAAVLRDVNLRGVSMRSMTRKVLGREPIAIEIESGAWFQCAP